MSKHYEYAEKLIGALVPVFEDKDSEFYIDLEEVDDNSGELTDVVHAILNVVPTHLVRMLTNQKDNSLLKSNHQANQLIMQYKGDKIKENAHKYLKDNLSTEEE